MTTSALRHLSASLLPSLVLMTVFAACHCDSAPPKPFVKPCEQNDDCKTDEDCQQLKANPKTGAPDADPTNWACNVTNHLCVQKQRTCADDTDCGPGQACNQTIGTCTDKYTQCTTDDPTACAVKGQYCEPALGVFPVSSGCTFHTCTEDPECADGLSCFNGYCVGEPPCLGGCAPGSVCTPANNLCYKLKMDDTTGMVDTKTFPFSGCDQSCSAGTILVFQDGHNVFNTFNPGPVDLCDVSKGSALTCVCAPLPKIKALDGARFSSSTVAGDKILVSAYDGDHGDLIIHTYKKGTDTTPIEFLTRSGLMASRRRVR